MKDKLITVVVPVYKAESYLDKCVSSIVNQTYHNLEIILVDDGSPDQCPQMCDAWAKRDNRVKVIHKMNEGAGIARNVALSNARGDYICFVDSDDYMVETAFEKAIGIARKEGSDVVIFGSHQVNEADEIVNTVIPDTYKNIFRGEDVQKVFLPDLIENEYVGARNTGLTLSFWVCLFSMELVRRAHWCIVSERDFVSEDSYSLLSLYAHINQVSILPEALYCYRLSVGSLSRTYRDDGHRKYQKLYHVLSRLTEKLGYSMDVRKRLSGLYLNQVIGMMKQIAASNLEVGREKALFREIITDELLQNALRQIDWEYRSKAKQFLLHQMRCKRVWCVRLLTVFQIYKENLLNKGNR